MNNLPTRSLAALAVTLLLGAWGFPAFGNSDCDSAFRTLYGTGGGTTHGSAGCQTCHSSIPSRNGYGADVGACTMAAIQAAESLDSDTAAGQPSVGGNNLTEITAGAQPGWCVADTPGCVNEGVPPAGITLDPPAGNDAPTAAVGGPYEGEIGAPVQFDGSGSSDPEGVALEYTWNFGDGTTGTGATPTHTFDSSGVFSVSLTVSDGQNVSPMDTTTATITDPVTNTPPTAAAGGPYEGEAGVPVQFDGSGSFDPDGASLSYSWDFGDETTGTGVMPLHTYASGGVYTVTLIVNDGLADSQPGTAQVTISEPMGDVPPVADAGGPYSGQTGVSVQFDGTRSSDGNGDALSFRWDFGDGSLGEGPTPVHTYTAAATYTVALVVNDGQSDSARSETTAEITNPVSGGDGAALYNVNCLGCHGDPWEDPASDANLPGKRRVAGSRECTIHGSIFGTSVYPGGVPGMQYLQDVLSDTDIEALADYLNSMETSGEQRYVSACAGCHGVDGYGGAVDEDIHGEEAEETAEAIAEEEEMRFLECLPESDIIAISDYLAGFDDDFDDDGIRDDEDPDDDNDGIRDEDDPDDDNDELDDDEEREYGTDPRDDDSDDDGLKDGSEVDDHGTDPADHDSDDDDVDDGREIEDRTDPLDADTDDDDLNDGEEVEAGTDPLNPDTDGDGFSDGEEVKVMGTDPLQKTSADVGVDSGGGGGGAGLWLLFLLGAGLTARGVLTVTTRLR